MHICIYIYIYIYTYTHTFIHIHMYIYIYGDTSVYVQISPSLFYAKGFVAIVAGVAHRKTRQQG